MTLESKTKFAKRLGINKSHLSRGKALEWLVMVGALVNVEESMERRAVFASSDPHHVAHALRLDEERAAKANATLPGYVPPAGDAEAAESLVAIQYRRAKADANKREHEAEMALMTRETQAGNLIAREEVEFAMDDLGATLRSLMENLADRLAPVVHPLQSLEETHAALAEAAQDVLQTVHDQLQRRAQERRAA